MKHFRMTAKCQIVAWNVIEDSQMRENWKITWWVSIWSWGRMFVGNHYVKWTIFWNILLIPPSEPTNVQCFRKSTDRFITRYGCDQSYNDRSNRRQHEKRAHGIVGPREAEKEELERKLSEKESFLRTESFGQTESFHPTGSFDQNESVTTPNLSWPAYLLPRPLLIIMFIEQHEIIG